MFAFDFQCCVLQTKSHVHTHTHTQMYILTVLSTLWIVVPVYFYCVSDCMYPGFENLIVPLEYTVDIGMNRPYMYGS